jgi:hypothetical protein
MTEEQPNTQDKPLPDAPVKAQDDPPSGGGGNSGN